LRCRENPRFRQRASTVNGTPYTPRKGRCRVDRQARAGVYWRTGSGPHPRGPPGERGAMADRTDLGRLIESRLRELGRSYRQAAAASGGRVSHATLNQLVTGRYRWRLDEVSLLGIALATDTPLADVRKAAGEDGTPPVAVTLPSRSGRLSPRGRAALVAMMDALLSAEAAAAARDDDDTRGDQPRQQ
jgi:hypothetical protein